jgi:hypothetical protein
MPFDVGETKMDRTCFRVPLAQVTEHGPASTQSLTLQSTEQGDCEQAMALDETEEDTLLVESKHNPPQAAPRQYLVCLKIPSLPQVFEQGTVVIQSDHWPATGQQLCRASVKT